MMRMISLRHRKEKWDSKKIMNIYLVIMYDQSGYEEVIKAYSNKEDAENFISSQEKREEQLETYRDWFIKSYNALYDYEVQKYDDIDAYLNSSEYYAANIKNFYLKLKEYNMIKNDMTYDFIEDLYEYYIEENHLWGDSDAPYYYDIKEIKLE